jgi:hypothetical protein
LYLFACTVVTNGLSQNDKQRLDEIIEPNEEVQSFFRKFTSAERKKRLKILKKFNFDESKDHKKQLKRIFSELIEKAGGSKQIIEQLLYFSVKADETREAMLPAIFFQHSRLTRLELLEGLVPYLSVEHDKLRQTAAGSLPSIEGGKREERGKGQGRMPYQIVISKRQDDLPVQLIKHMYKRNPHRAIEVMVSVLAEGTEQVQKEGLLKLVDEVNKRIERIKTLFVKKKKLRQEGETQKIQSIEKRMKENKSYVKKEIKKWATSNVWWIRLYAAGLMRQNPRLRDNNIIQEMKEDPHELVREVTRSINKWNQRPGY